MKSVLLRINILPGGNMAIRSTKWVRKVKGEKSQFDKYGMKDWLTINNISLSIYSLFLKRKNAWALKNNFGLSSPIPKKTAIAFKSFLISYKLSAIKEIPGIAQMCIFSFKVTSCILIQRAIFCTRSAGRQ